MLSLLDLPNEVLQDVVSYVRPCRIGGMSGAKQLSKTVKLDRAATTGLLSLSYTSKRLNRLTERVLYRDIRLSVQNCKSLRVLLNNIITRPELATRITRIVFFEPEAKDYVNGFGQTSISSSNADDAKVNQVFVKAAAALAPRIWAAQRWFNELRAARQDALMALLIYHAANLKELCIEYEFDQTDYTMYCNDGGSSVSKSLPHLRAVMVRGSLPLRSTDFNLYCALPMLQEFHGHEVCYGLVFSGHRHVVPTSLALTTLELDDFLMREEALLHLLTHCTALNSLSLQGHSDFSSNFRLQSIVNALRSVCTLEKLELRGPIFYWQSLTDVPQLQRLSKLRNLSIDTDLILKHKPATREMLPRLLPPQIVELTLHCGFSDDWLLRPHLNALADNLATRTLPTFTSSVLTVPKIAMPGSYTVPQLDFSRKCQMFFQNMRKKFDSAVWRRNGFRSEMVHRHSSLSALEAYMNG